MSENAPQCACESKALAHKLGVMMGALWIAGGTAYFMVRFSILFYQANQSAIDRVLGRLF